MKSSASQFVLATFKVEKLLVQAEAEEVIIEAMEGYQ